MCLAVPMQLVAIENAPSAIADLDGSRQRVDVSLIEDPAVGDFVIVHAGYAIERLDAVEADARLDFFAELAAAND